MRKIPVYTHPAAGWPALISSTRKLMDYKAFMRGSVSVLHSNQPKGGFDCPGCAWPDHKTHKVIDVCENGIKVIASETMNQRADAAFFARHSVTELQSWSGYELEHSGRLSEPLYYDAAQDRYVAISWQAAYERIADVLKNLDSPDEALFYTSGRVTNEPAFMFQLFVRCFGTNNLPDCSNMCHEPTSVMLGKQLGVGKATVVLEDFEQAKLIMLFGQNPATNHPRMLEMLAHAHKQGCRIISINPMREQGLSKFRNPQKPTHMAAGQSDEMVDEVIQIQIGGDVALLTGLAKWLVENDKIDSEFISTHTSGFDDLKQWLVAQSWTDIELGSGITQADIINLAKLVADSPATICTWGMGITQHVQGEDNVAMITNLLLLMGMIGIDGAGASPVRGHSNVQGDRTMGIHERPKQSLL
ncbi:MAG: molybdopterin-dependent oxidoreductase, partial [Psychrobacter sp.]|nr:molybdopterin-dependent oxidoreductase [Psychrobacter sp.]